MSTDSRALSLLRQLAAHAPTPLPAAAVTLLLAAAADHPQALTELLVARVDIEEDTALAMTLKYRAAWAGGAFLSRPGVSDAAVEKLLAKDTRITVWRALAAQDTLSPHAYRVLAGSIDIDVRANLLGNRATPADLAVQLWTSFDRLKSTSRPVGSFQLYKRVIAEGFGQLGADALHALLTCPQVGTSLPRPTIGGPALPALRMSAAMLPIWPRLHAASKRLVVDSVLASLRDRDPASPADLLQVHSLVKTVADEPDLLAVVQAALPDLGTPLGAAAHPHAALPYTLSWSEASPARARVRTARRVERIFSSGLAADLVAACGNDPGRWQVLLALNADFPGTAQDMLDVVAGITS